MSSDDSRKLERIEIGNNLLSPVGIKFQHCIPAKLCPPQRNSSLLRKNLRQMTKWIL
jgi:hypothetical protein